MRLINTSTWCLEEFLGAKTPPFAILSHRWTSQEVTLGKLSDEKLHTSPAFQKINVEMPFGEARTVVVFVLHTSRRGERPWGRLLKVGFDIDFNPIVRVDNQWNRDMKNLKDDWMKEEFDRYSTVLKGERLRGCLMETSFTALKLTDEKIGHRRMWAVEFYIQGDKDLYEPTCVKCTGVIRGIRYQCQRCKSLHFCEGCSKTPSVARHASHGWKIFEMQDGKTLPYYKPVIVPELNS